ncbi:hypothetical protein BU23DRAFT_561008 [Bimuria novae-zelandiae CBS 107.79]|uniref:Methyltransferase domain-containing protein n=1 Tax=Bimuria novae-zelandiae CBS 107.79 TaxID=1447943 RepID=A0A6A5ULI9_9PLEO|nr:hypothetical protein BU23DRAFT_561008 [Bimuria novae-zelandiae CBS 107.79]
MLEANAVYDQEGAALFAFHDLNYIPFGFSSDEAPYIETPIATMRAAATLMGLDNSSDAMAGEKTVVCDLGCGDGDLLISLLRHINTFKTATPSNAIDSPRPQATGVGIDYSPALIEAAILASEKQAVHVAWRIYDFNADLDDIVNQLLTVQHVTHVFVYLTPKQLALPTVHNILVGLCKGGVMVCCYKYHPLYLKAARSDKLMELVVFDASS